MLSNIIFGLTAEYRRLREKMDTQLCYEDSHSWDFTSIKAFKTAIKMSEILENNPENTKEYYSELLDVGGFIGGVLSFPPVKKKALRALAELNIDPQTIKQRARRFYSEYKNTVYTFMGFTRKESMLISRAFSLSRSEPKNPELSSLIKKIEELFKAKPEKIFLRRVLVVIYYRRKDFKKFIYHFKRIHRDIDAFLSDSPRVGWALHTYRDAFSVLGANSKEAKKILFDLLSKKVYAPLLKNTENYFHDVVCLEFYIHLFKAPRNILKKQFHSLMFWFSNPKFRRQFDGFAKLYLAEKETLYAIFLWKEYLYKRSKRNLFKRQLKNIYHKKDLNRRFQNTEIRKKIRKMLQEK